MFVPPKHVGIFVDGNIGDGHQVAIEIMQAHLLEHRHGDVGEKAGWVGEVQLRISERRSGQ